ncbi:hypothetical protein MLD38_013853 [Melastoma candidum]|uniref:Uncharacterized protein n=1 Tax=Melastoma candidum TaxID=119954 RepID=A0ACB9RJD5_9MYRT|nr:hypothetical protein MLD38_013853 [Melastoma candidum]
MGKVKGKHRLDKFYRLAKEHGYRSRASWKLIQLDSKHDFLRSSRAVLDLCAAPGGWMQVAVQRVPVASLVLGIDLVPIAPIRGAISFEGDITRPECKAGIKRVMGERGVRAFDLVLHDGSPNVGGAWAQEAVSQNALVIDAVKLATQFLAPKGNFVTKVFRSQDYNAVLYCLKQLFEKVEVDKPAASRSTSAEIFVLGLKYKAPAKIDPRLLDFKHLFQGPIDPPKKVVDVLRGTKQKRHRDGYEDGDVTLRKVSSAADFIWSDTPLEILGSVSTISFDDPASLPFKEHNLTTQEVKLLCEDLRVLGKQDFKHLLKWRMHIRKAFAPTKETDSTSKVVESDNKEDEDDRILNEMEEMQDALDRKKKRKKKLLAKRRAKDKARKATGMQVDALEDGYIDEELFSLSSIKGKKELVALDTTNLDEEASLRGSDDEDATKETEEPSSSDVDSDEERRRYDEKLEEFLDQAYERFASRKEGSTKQRKRAKQAYADKDQLLQDAGEDMPVHSDDELDKAGHDETNPLMVSLDNGEAPTQEEMTSKWFSQDIFAEAVEGGDLGEIDTEDEMQVEEPVEKRAKLEDNRTGNNVALSKKDKMDGEGGDDFEIVPAPAAHSSDDYSSSDSEEEDDDTKAEILACAKKMLRKRQREQILDDAYNKYMFDDEGLPKWFLDEEQRHRVPIKPVTKEEIAAMRAQFKEIDARPAKKVAEAKNRKKRAAMKKLEKVRKKANTISDQADISDRSKRKMIDQLYKKAAPKRPQKEYVVAKKGVQVKGGKGKVIVDRRMKKDARTRGMGKSGRGSSSKKKGKDVKSRNRKGPGSGNGPARKGGKPTRGGNKGGSRD